MTKEELIIVEGKIGSVYVKGKEETDLIKPEFTEYVTEEWNAHKAINGEPQYVAIHVKGTRSIRVIMEIDHKDSRLDEGHIVPLGKPISVYIPIRRYGKNKLRGINYTTFKKLITHKSTDDL
jgi:hypothetical protein